MNTLFHLLTCLWLSYAPLNVMSYGATGNGTTDDTAAINAALTAAHNAGKSLYFPPGTYFCNTHDGSGHILTFNAGGLNNVTLYGSGATILTNDTGTASLTSVLLYVYSFAASSGLFINGLRFISTHGRTNQQTAGVFITGTAGQLVTNASVQYCTFSNFAQDLGGQGINGWAVKYDSFLSPNGHDGAFYGSNSSNPACQLFLYDNTNGYITNADIEFNYAAGYTGSFPMTARRPMDGFVHGYAYGLNIATNQTIGFCEEQYLILPPTTTPGTTAKVILGTNTANCSLPAGITDDNGAPHKYNYGIRCDAPHATITGNTLINPAWGIMQRGFDYGNILLQDLNITNNTIRVPTDTNTVIYQQAIFVDENASYPVPLVSITNNWISGIDTVCIQALNTTAPVTTPNYWSPAIIR